MRPVPGTGLPRMGVLALQGAVSEHIDSLAACGVDAVQVRKPADLDGLDGLVIPGGESTAIGGLMFRSGLARRIVELAAPRGGGGGREGGRGAPAGEDGREGGRGAPAGKDGRAPGLAVMGTCAGMILLARHIEDSDQPRLGLMDIAVRRNASGRQVDSFETDLAVPVIGPEPFRGVFIRAPYVTGVGPGVEVLSRVDGVPVAARRGRIVGLSFHPELTGDPRLHRYFVDVAAGRR